MNTELTWLTYVTVLTGLLWLPYILDRILVRGLLQAVGYPADPKPQSAWAQRLMKAHSNAVENLAVFAPLVLVANAAGLHGGVIATACMVYFWARVVHALAYAFAIAWVRTLAFAAGVAAQMTIAIHLL